MSTKKKKPEEENGTPTAGVRHRIVAPIQVRGNIGKSTEAIVRGEWMRARNVEWQGFDLDQDNRTLSDVFPEEVKRVELSSEPQSDLIRILRAGTQARVTTIDPRAHLQSLILETLRMLRFPELAAAEGCRLTVLVFPIDELSDMDDIDRTVAELGGSVDWVIVRNPLLQRRTRMFDGSELEAELLRLGAATLTLPALLSDTRTYLRSKEVKLGRAISPAEALKNPEIDLHITHRMVLEDWLRKLFRQYDLLAGHFLPSEEAGRIAAPEPEEVHTVASRPQRRGARVNLANIE